MCVCIERERGGGRGIWEREIKYRAFHTIHIIYIFILYIYILAPYIYIYGDRVKIYIMWMVWNALYFIMCVYVCWHVRVCKIIYIHMCNREPFLSNETRHINYEKEQQYC